MANPTIADISAILDDMESEAAGVDQADRAYQKAQARLKELRQEIDVFISDLAAELRHILRKQEGPERRRSMRRFGFYFGPNGELSPTDPEEPDADVESEPGSEPQPDPQVTQPAQ